MLKDNQEIKRLKDENRRLKELLNLKEKSEKEKLKVNITDLIDIDQLEILFEKFSKLTGYTAGFVDHETSKVLISTGWTTVCKEYHRGSKSSEHICLQSNKELTKDLVKPNQIKLHQCQHGMVDGATPIIVDGEHLANIFSGQVLFDKPDIENFKISAREYGYDVDSYIKEIEKVKILSEDKLKEALEFLSFIANLVAQIGKEKKEYIKLNSILEQ